MNANWKRVLTSITGFALLIGLKGDTADTPPPAKQRAAPTVPSADIGALQTPDYAALERDAEALSKVLENAPAREFLIAAKLAEELQDKHAFYLLLNPETGTVRTADEARAALVAAGLLPEGVASQDIFIPPVLKVLDTFLKMEPEPDRAEVLSLLTSFLPAYVEHQKRAIEELYPERKQSGIVNLLVSTGAYIASSLPTEVTRSISSRPDEFLNQLYELRGITKDGLSRLHRQHQQAAEKAPAR